MTDSERKAQTAEEIKLIAAREIASLLGCALLVLMLHPGVQLWVRHQAWKVRQLAGRRGAAEEAAVAKLRRDISAWEHEQRGQALP